MGKTIRIIIFSFLLTGCITPMTPSPDVPPASTEAKIPLTVGLVATKSLVDTTYETDVASFKQRRGSRKQPDVHHIWIDVGRSSLNALQDTLATLFQEVRIIYRETPFDDCDFLVIPECSEATAIHHGEEELKSRRKRTGGGHLRGVDSIEGRVAYKLSLVSTHASYGKEITFTCGGEGQSGSGFLGNAASWIFFIPTFGKAEQIQYNDVYADAFAQAEETAMIRLLQEINNSEALQEFLAGILWLQANENRCLPLDVGLQQLMNDLEGSYKGNETYNLLIESFEWWDGRSTRLESFLTERIPFLLNAERWRLLDRKSYIKQLRQIVSLQEKGKIQIKEIGSLTGADALLVGNILDSESCLEIEARVVEVERGIVRAVARTSVKRDEEVKRLMELPPKHN